MFSRIALKLLPLILATLVLGGCGEPASTLDGKPEPEREEKLKVKLDAEFHLPIHGSARLEAHNLDIVFADVTEDTRCPIGDRCIWAGQVSMLVQLSRGDESLGETKLTSRVGEHDSSGGSVGGFSVRLISIEPYPESGKPVEKSQYVATLMISQAE